MKIPGVSQIQQVFTGDRAAQNESDRLSKESINRFKAFGMNELGQYKTGSLQPGQEKLISDTQEKGEELTQQFTSHAQVSEGFKKSMNDHFLMDSSIMREVFQEGHLSKAIQALGYSWEQTQELLNQHAEERRQKDAAIGGMMKAVGTAIAIFALA